MITGRMGDQKTLDAKARNLGELAPDEHLALG
jgi:hypothetical protein